jgi:hypothetical protein
MRRKRLGFIEGEIDFIRQAEHRTLRLRAPSPSRCNDAATHRLPSVVLTQVSELVGESYV